MFEMISCAPISDRRFADAAAPKSTNTAFCITLNTHVVRRTSFAPKFLTEPRMRKF